MYHSVQDVVGGRERACVEAEGTWELSLLSA